MRQLARCLAACTLAAALVSGAAADEKPVKEVKLGYIELKRDARYSKRHLRARFPGQPWGRPRAGAEVALKELKFQAQAAGVRFTLEVRSVRKPEGLSEALAELSVAGAGMVLTDLPSDALLGLQAELAGKPLALLNVSAHEDGLRGAGCHPQVLHVAPSYAMLMDALGQYLVFKKWREVLVLAGPDSRDKLMLSAFQRTAKRFDLDIVDVRDFVLGTDPRRRGQNNVALLTARSDHDVVFVADARGEFARDVPYQTQSPRPVVGAAGLVADAWHWAWERHGAPQLSKRFAKHAERPMAGPDWAAWMAVKVIGEALLRTGSTDTAALLAYMRGPELIADGFKGNRSNFRRWNNQLRQPLLLTHDNWVVARAPLEGFLHRTNHLDLLGVDAPETACKF